MSRMSSLSHSLCLASIFGLFPVCGLLAADDLSTKVRGWYVTTQDLSQCTININFDLHGSFWQASLRLIKSDPAIAIGVTQFPYAGKDTPSTCFHSATASDLQTASQRLFFDARFWSDPHQQRPVLVRRVDNLSSKVSVIFVEPLP